MATEAMAEVFPMNGGDGTHSYTKNSQTQKEGSDAVKEMIQETIVNKLNSISTSTTAITIADLGCSVGPNTFFAVENLIQALEIKCSKSLDFQVFFNDLPSNDFNTLFASLPTKRKYHVAGVPGSFYARLFPVSSIHVAFSSHALPWLSTQPRLGLPGNEGRIHHGGAPEHVLGAYSGRFETDFGVFMSARAEEIVSGGLMFLVLPAARHCHRVSQSELPDGTRVMFDFLGFSLMDLANEGVVEKSAVDAFNLPVYYPTQEEMRKVVEKNECFSIEKMEVADFIRRENDVARMIMHLRAAVEGTLTAYFGDSVVDKLFFKMFAKIEQISEVLEAGHVHTQLFAALKRY